MSPKQLNRLKRFLDENDWYTHKVTRFIFDDDPCRSNIGWHGSLVIELTPKEEAFLVGSTEEEEKELDRRILIGQINRKIKDVKDRFLLEEIYAETSKIIKKEVKDSE